MKHWNYRIIEFPGNGDEPAWRELREVYYDESGKPSAYGAAAQVAWSVDENPATPLHIVERMREAINKPVLDVRDFEYEEDPAADGKATSYTITLQKDPDSDDVVLPIPKSLLIKEDWRVGDRLKIEVISQGRCSLTNLSKAERESKGRKPRSKKTI